MVTENVTWTLVQTVVSPYAATYRGGWRRIWGEFTSAELTPEECVAEALAMVAQEGSCIILSGALWAPAGSEDLSDHWYMDVTLGLNPEVYPLGSTVEPSIWGWIIGGIALIFGGGALTGNLLSKGSDGGDGDGAGGGSMIESIMPLMIIMMMMGMIQR